MPIALYTKLYMVKLNRPYVRSSLYKMLCPVGLTWLRRVLSNTVHNRFVLGLAALLFRMLEYSGLYKHIVYIPVNGYI